MLEEILVRLQVMEIVQPEVYSQVVDVAAVCTIRDSFDLFRDFSQVQHCNIPTPSMI